MIIRDGYYWRIDRSISPAEIEIIEVRDGDVFFVGSEMPFPIRTLEGDHISIIKIEPPDGVTP